MMMLNSLWAYLKKQTYKRQQDEETANSRGTFKRHCTFLNYVKWARTNKPGSVVKLVHNALKEDTASQVLIGRTHATIWRRPKPEISKEQ